MAEENDSEKLGMVVFGVGIAGRVRIRDLKDPDYQDGGWKLVGFVSRYINPFPTIPLTNFVICTLFCYNMDPDQTTRMVDGNLSDLYPGISILFPPFTNFVICTLFCYIGNNMDPDQNALESDQGLSCLLP